MEDLKVRVLLEDIRHEYKTLGEGINSLLPMKDKVDNMEKDIKDIKEDISIIKSAMPHKANVSRVEKIEADVVVLQQKIA